MVKTPIQKQKRERNKSISTSWIHEKNKKNKINHPDIKIVNKRKNIPKAFL